MNFKLYLRMKATICLNERNVWDDDENNVRVFDIELNDSECEELQKWDTERIFNHVRSNCVGKCNTWSSDEGYFVPEIVVGCIRVSVQANYYLWSQREDDLAERCLFYHDKEEHKAYHMRIVTAEEFDRCKSVGSWFDVRIIIDGTRCFLGRWRCDDISDLFQELIAGQKVEFDVY